ncbi:MAG: hypothetical protein ABEJ81_05765 [Haloferacaceae archaeon]
MRMGMKTFERLESILGPDDAEEPFVCRSCGATHEVGYYVCPACGGFSVEHRVEDVWDAG